MAANRQSAGELNKVPAVFWRELPDPRDPCAPEGQRTELFLDRYAWEHVLSKHVFPGREPWADVFSAERLRGLRRVEDVSAFADPDVAAAVEAVGCEIRRALERPLALLYEVGPLGESGRRPARRWILVLPSGATAHVKETKDGNRLATCYFPAYGLVLRNRKDRWRRVVKHLVWRYGEFDGQRNAVWLPSADLVKHFPSKSPFQEQRSAIRFVTPSTWGFCPELEGCPWRGRLSAWSASEAPSPRPRHRLKPRRRPPEEEGFTK